jgi:DNA polymerase
VKLGSCASSEADVRALDGIVNARGFRFDSALAEAVVALDFKRARDAQKNANVSASILSSPRKLRALLVEWGVPVHHLRRDNLEALLDDPDLPDDARRVLVARLASSGITSTKLLAALRRVSADGRLRDSLVYAGAHTGRWSGRGFQPQNLPRIARGLDVKNAVTVALANDAAELATLALKANISIDQVLSSLVRPCICAVPGKILGIFDYATIEPRVLCWAAQDSGLENYRRGCDTYKIMSGLIYGVAAEDVTDEQRKLGKPLELGSGFRMGAARFEAYAETFGVDWAQVPFTASALVELWRDAHPAIAGTRTGRTFDGAVHRTGGLWRTLEQAVTFAIQSGPIRAALCTWEMCDGDLLCNLPSGRVMVYRDARLEEMPTPWGGSKETMTYALPSRRMSMHGGRLAENITQAIARDILADALLRLEAAAIETVLHVHDEVVAELRDKEELQRVKAIMEQPPAWAKTLPIRIEAYASERYHR